MLGFMGTSPTQGRRAAVVSYLAVGFVIALVIGQSLNPAIGPFEETHGVVQGSAFVPADGPAPSRNIWVLLSNGTTVVINAPTYLLVTPGQKVKLLVYRRLLTNAKSYAIVSAGVTQ
ncbi:MAG: hypothetical protein HC889_06565 [Synechococcaceae cyanobacterium SM1_2_3]|nr:hypothetical protein [Synechococcaceae cyanobacterium SM1_2_3]